ncbi:hypothetical protein [Flaviflagellibacter deserti]|uniref:PD-(D/E)XK nuclease superfamily protein n=1 Tax=Flaviflagellibacter deserti TaxID=2267266 RepID=A0ABV9Z585_9HYPH
MLQSFVEKLSPAIEKTVSGLAKERFRTDPIAGPKFSRATSIISAAYKRHGRILEEALRLRLSECQHFSVWTDPNFSISDTADRAIRGRNSDIEESLPIELPYGGSGRALQVDLFVFDRRISTLRAYEVKRGNGAYDSGKKRSILRDLLCVQSLLRSYGGSRGLIATSAEARLISYYGVRALPAPLNLFGHELDDHFVFPVQKYVDAVNERFQERLYDLLSDVLGLTELERAALCQACPLHRPLLHH